MAVRCRCVLIPTLPVQAYWQPAPDAHPVEVTVLHAQNQNVHVVEAKHGAPFRLMTQAGWAVTNFAPVLAEHVILYPVKS